MEKDLDLTPDPKFLKNVKAYCGTDKDKYDYVKLWKLIQEDVEQRETQARFELQKKIEAENAPPPAPEQKDAPVAAPADQPLTQLQRRDIRSQVIAFYGAAQLFSDKLIDHLMMSSSAKDVEQKKLCKKLAEDIKPLQAAEIEKFVAAGAKDRLLITKAELKDLLLEDAVKQLDYSTMKIDEQLETVFNEIDVERKGAIESTRLTQAFKLIGVHKSQPETDVLFHQFKKSSAAFMDREDFARLMKHELSDCLAKKGLMREKLVEAVRSVDPYHCGYLNFSQLQ